MLPRAGLTASAIAMVLLVALPSPVNAQAIGCYACSEEHGEDVCDETDGWGGDDPDCNIFKMCDPEGEECWAECAPRGEICGPPEAVSMSGQVVAPVAGDDLAGRLAEGGLLRTKGSFVRACDGALVVTVPEAEDTEEVAAARARSKSLRIALQ